MTHADRVAIPCPSLVSSPPATGPDYVALARAGDPHAFESLYREHVRRIYAVCFRMTANVARAEDLTQKAFVTAWQKLAHFRGESAFSSWLQRIAVNTVLADLRAEHRRTQRVFGTEDPSVFESTSPPPPAGIRLDLEAAIATLPPQARAVFVLHDVEGWQHQEIATQLGVTTGTTKAQLHRARQLLQEALR